MFLISISLAGGNIKDISTELRSIPRKVKQVFGPSTFSITRPKPKPSQWLLRHTYVTLARGRVTRVPNLELGVVG